MRKSLAWFLTAAFVCALAVFAWSKHGVTKRPVGAEAPTVAERSAAPPSVVPRDEVRATQPTERAAPPHAEVAKPAVEPSPTTPKPQSAEDRSGDRALGLQKSRALLTESVAWLKERRRALGAESSHLAEAAVLDRRIERLTRRLQTLEQGRDPDEGVAVSKN
jgi:hypothetical protein